MRAAALMAGSVAAVALLAGAAVQQGWWRKPVPVSRGAHLMEVLREKLDGIPARDLPLGPDEGGDDLVRRVLRCDDVVYRAYNLAAGELQIYAGYWAANKMPSQLVASHTPDRCWTDNGWNCSDMKFRQVWRVDGVTLIPGEWRRFSAPRDHGSMDVMYWHSVAGQAYRYGDSFNHVLNPVRYWKDYAAYLVAGSGEQYFVRVTSRRPFEELALDPAWPRIIRALAELGLKADRAATMSAE